MNKPISEEAIRQAIPNSIGGKFFKNLIKTNDVDTAVLNSVIHMNGMFEPDNKDPRSYNELIEHYRFLNDHGREFFFNFDSASVSGDYGIFSFHTSTNWKSLTELKTPLDDAQALEIFKALVKLIYSYSRSAINSKKYHPLLFICKESVYFCCEDNKLTLRLLPLLFDLNTQYAGLPKEIFVEGGDITSDLFMAAYLYLLLKYPNGENFAANEYSKYDVIAERCISPFIQRRYSAEQLLGLLDNPETTVSIPENKPSVGPIVVSSATNGTPVSKKGNSDCEKQRKPLLSFLSRLLNKIIPMRNPVFETAKNVAKNTVNAENVVDMFSTQEGDDQEDNN